MARLLYQRFLEVEPPERVGTGAVPIWSWPVVLGDGRMVLTLLYRPLGLGAGRVGAVTQILLLDRDGGAAVWGPGLGYEAGVIFFATQRDELVGFDWLRPGKIYACAADGRHLWTLETSVRQDNLLCPASFFEHGGRLYWRNAENGLMSADLFTGEPRDLRAESEGVAAGPREVHHPHTHWVGAGLFVLEFDPFARISFYGVGEE